MNNKMYPSGFNIKHKLVTDALTDYIASKQFQGVVSPGSFYDYCNNISKYTEIDKYFFYQWVDLELSDLCEIYDVAFRKSKPKNTTSQSANRTAIEFIDLAKECPKNIDVKTYISNQKHQKRDTVSAGLNRSVGTENLDYLVSIKFKTSHIPILSRVDLKDFFTSLRVNKLTDMNSYIKYLKLNLSKKVKFGKFPEHQPTPESGWVYLFNTKSDPNIVKCGRSIRQATKRLEEHILSNLASESIWSYIFKSDDVVNHETVLKSILNVEGLVVPNTTECFTLQKKGIEDIWRIFIARVET